MKVQAWILGTAVLAGCARPSLPARMPSEAELARPSIDHRVRLFEGAKKIALFEQRWLPRNEPRGVLMIVHGLKDHGSRYDRLATQLAEKGFAVYAFDLPGHGRSAGARVTVGSFDDYLTDVGQAIAHARGELPKQPLFLLGHSMGGTIATRYGELHNEQLAGLLLSGAALTRDASWFKVAGVKMISVMSPNAGVFQLDLHDFSRDRAVVEAGERDALVYEDAAPAHTAVVLLNAIEQTREHMGELKVPLLVMHGAADKVTSPEGSRELMARAGSRDKTLKLYPGLYHDLLHEPEHARVEQDIYAWLDARAR